MFQQPPPDIIGPIFERAIHQYETVLKKVRSKLIGDTTPIWFVITSLVIPVKIWLTTFTSHTIHTVHIHHPYVISDLLVTWKDYIFVLQSLELSDERPVVLACGRWRLVKQRFVLSLSQVLLQKSQII